MNTEKKLANTGASSTSEPPAWPGATFSPFPSSSDYCLLSLSHKETAVFSNIPLIEPFSIFPPSNIFRTEAFHQAWYAMETKPL